VKTSRDSGISSGDPSPNMTNHTSPLGSDTSDPRSPSDSQDLALRRRPVNKLGVQRSSSSSSIDSLTKKSVGSGRPRPGKHTVDTLI